MVDRKGGALTLQRKQLLACIVGVLLVMALAFTGCAQQETARSASTASSAQSSQAASSTQEGAQETGLDMSVTVVVMNPDNADVEAHNIPVMLQEDATVYDALEATGLETKIEDGPYGMYMTELDGKAAEGGSGWVYTVNGEEVMESIDACHLGSGDTVEFKYITM